MPKYPGITANIIGLDGNAFAIVGLVAKELRSGGVPQDEVKQFQNEAMSGDYNHLLQVVMEWVNVGSEDDYLDEVFEDWEEDIDTCPYCGDDYFNCYCDEEDDED